MKSRRFTSTVLGIMIIFSAFTVLNFTSMNVIAAGTQYEGWSGDKYITTDDTFPYTGNDSAVLNLTDGNLIICDGVTLTFNDNVTFNMRNTVSSGYYGIQINSTAKFVVNSALSTTTIKTHTTTPSTTYSFTNSGTIDFL